MPKRKKSPKRLTPPQVAELQAMAAKIHDDREALAVALRSSVRVMDEVRNVPSIHAFDDVAVAAVVELAQRSHAALQKSEGRATGKRGGRKTKLPADWKALKAQHPNWNQKKLAFELKVSESTLSRAQKKDRS